MSTDAPIPPRATILVVDDIPDNITVLSGILRGDYDVRFATSGAKALEQIESSTPPDLVLLDVMMPTMDGLEVCAKVKANPARAHLPVIFVSALGEVEDEQKGLELGAVDYLTKPVSAPVVRARVKNHLELARAQARLAQENVLLEEKVRERTVALVQANTELRTSYLESIDLAFGLMGEADARLGEHCRRVATYVKAMCPHLGLDEEATFDLGVAALLHDLGLVALNGEGLDDAMRLEHPSPTREPVYHSHPTVHMAAMLEGERFVRIAKLIGGHHESLDGSGFPGGVRGEEIPYGSRVIAAADRWDVFTQLAPTERFLERTFDALVDVQRDKLDAPILEALREVLRAGDPFSRVLDRAPAGLEAGMIVARNVHTPSGATLLHAGTVLREDHIADLARHEAGGELELPVQVFRPHDGG
ncbi:MAG: response regulator [Deltaproteobacteria bacterium]|nr:response regulator [Deltaproteobacteria bacterium]